MVRSTMITRQELESIAQDLQDAAQVLREMDPADATVRSLEYIQNYTYGATESLHGRIDQLMEEVK